MEDQKKTDNPERELVKLVFDYFMKAIESNSLEREKGEAVKRQDYVRAQEIHTRQKEVQDSMPTLDVMKLWREKLNEVVVSPERTGAIKLDEVVQPVSEISTASEKNEVHPQGETNTTLENDNTQSSENTSPIQENTNTVTEG